MNDFDQLKQSIDEYIRVNGRGYISGPALNNILKAMVDTLGAATGKTLLITLDGSELTNTPSADTYGNKMYIFEDSSTGELHRWITIQYDNGTYDWKDLGLTEEQLGDLHGGGFYNLDQLHPLVSGYYTLEMAVDVVANDPALTDNDRKGIIIQYFDGDVWKFAFFPKPYNAIDFADATLWMTFVDPYQADADHQRAESDHTRATNDHSTAVSDHTRAGTDHNTAVSDHTQATNDHTQAESDHTRAETDHTTASSDHTTATNDHTTAGTDHTRAESDHTRAVTDKEQAATDHNRAETDHNQAGQDHTQAGQDHLQADADHTQAVADSVRADNDHVQAGDDHTRAETDHTRAGNDHTQAVSDSTRAGNDHTQAASDHTQSGTDHTAAQQATAAANTAANNANTKASEANVAARAAEQAVVYAQRVNAELRDYELYVTDRNGNTVSKNVKGDKGDGINYNTLTDAQKQQLASAVVRQVTAENILGPTYDATNRQIIFPLSSGVRYDQTNRQIIFN